MKTGTIKLLGLLAAAGLLAVSVKAQDDDNENPCVDEPYYGGWSCLSPGTTNFIGTLNYTATNVCVGATVVPPVFTTNATFNNGSKGAYLYHTCPDYDTESVTQAVVYTPGSLYFVTNSGGSPPISGPFNATGTYYYTAKANGIPDGGVCNTITDIVATVSVTATCSPPVIVTQPASQTVVAGANATFWVNAIGCTYTSYQWQFNSNNIAGATNSSVTLTNAQPTNMGNYRVVVTNTLGSVISSNASLTVLIVPTNLLQGLVAYYPFNGDANDASGNGNNGTMAGSAGLGVDRLGNSNQSLSLPGTAGTGSGVDVPSLSNMAYRPVTYAAWFRLNDYPPLTGNQAVMTLLGREQCGDAYEGAICLYSQASALTNALLYYTGATGNYTLTPPTNQWCQIVLTIDTNGTVNWYFNATNVAGYGSAPAGQSLGFRIGASGSGGCGGTYRYVWNGRIDDVWIYNRVLSSNEVQQLYTYNPLDSDGNGLPDAWEIQYFGQIGVDPNADPDGDHLTNLEEYRMGYDPTNAHTGGSVASDGDKDYDGDLLSNIAELRVYNSNPTNAHTFNLSKTDAEYKTAAAMDGNTEATLYLRYAYGGWLFFEITGAPQDAAYDLYVSPILLEHGMPWRRYYSGSPGQRWFICPMPDPIQYPTGFFAAGLASDSDGDGLTDGYETLVSHTQVNNRSSDTDLLPDGWEVEYGLNPLKPLASDPPNDPDGNNGNPDNDALSNLQEFTGGTDPKRNNAGPQRPVITITANDATASERTGDTATFNITRSGTAGALTVYYTLGGSATYGADYSLSPSPSTPYPDGYSVTIQDGQPSAMLTVTPVTDTVQEGTERVIAWLAPSPADVYVVDPHQDHATVSIRDAYIRTYTLDVDFDQGVLEGLNHTATHDQLQLDGTPAGTPQGLRYVAVACTYRNTVVRIDAAATAPDTAVIGEYRTLPEWIDGNTTTPIDIDHGCPSRTTVDQYGNIWVGNRYDNWPNEELNGSITRIGLIIGTRYRRDSNGTYIEDTSGQYVRINDATYNTCIDRDGDGYIRTSLGIGSGNVLHWLNEHDEDSNGGVSTAEDEAITEYVRVPATGVRSIAVDMFNDVWVGGYVNNKQSKLDGLTAQVVALSTFTAASMCGGYGAAITPPTISNPNGVLWSANHNARYSSSTLRVELPTTFESGWPPSGNICQNITIPDCGVPGPGYGIAAYPIAGDSKSGEVWQTLYDEYCSYPDYGGFGLVRWHADGTIYTVDGTTVPKVYDHGGGAAKGLVIDDNRDIWVAHAEANTVGHLVYDSGTGDWIPATPGTVDLGDGGPHSPYGVAVDFNGKIWVANHATHNAMRINPNRGIGSPYVDLTVDLNQGWPLPHVAFPYNYSDMTGFNNHIVNPGLKPRKGYWVVVNDSGLAGMDWVKVKWTTTDPASGRIEVYVRAADTRAGLYSQGSQAFVKVQNDALLTTAVKGRFIEVRAALIRDAGSDEPVLKDLTLYGDTPTLLINPPQPVRQVVYEGANAAFSVIASGTDPLTYQWYHEGTAMSDYGSTISGATSPRLVVSDIHCLDEGTYYVRVQDASGTVADSDPAYMEMDARTITIYNQGLGTVPYPATINVCGLPTTVSKVTATIYGLSHIAPGNLGILLVSPRGQAVMLMSHAGGSDPIQNVVLTFDDSAAYQLPDTPPPQIYSGSYLPSPYTPIPTMPSVNPSPPPPPPYGTALSAFNGTGPNYDPNGTWQLYVYDFGTGSFSTGYITGSWCLSITP
jgi:hypothetical protein